MGVDGVTKENVFKQLDHAALDIIAMAEADADKVRAEIAETTSIHHLIDMVLMRRSYLGSLSDEVNIAQMMLMDEHDGETLEDRAHVKRVVDNVQQKLAAISSDLTQARENKLNEIKNALN